MSEEDIRQLRDYIDCNPPTIEGDPCILYTRLISYYNPIVRIFVIANTHWVGDIEVHKLDNLDEAIEEYKRLVNIPGELDLIK